jgi:hypothetical protein
MTTEPMNCNELVELVTAYLEGPFDELDPAFRNRLLDAFRDWR